MMNIYSRFWKKVDTSGGPDACWPWTSTVNTNGYPVIRVNGRTVLAHRLALQMAWGLEPPSDRVAMHHCDNPVCVNQKHLDWATGAENFADMFAKGRQASGERHATRLHPGMNRGERNGRARLRHSDRIVIRQRRATGESYVSISRDYGVTPESISNACRGVTWKGGDA